MAAEIEQLLTLKEVLKILRISRSTLLRWMARGLIPYHKIGSHYRYIPSEIQECIKEMKPAEQGEG